MATAEDWRLLQQVCNKLPLALSLMGGIFKGLGTRERTIGKLEELREAVNGMPASTSDPDVMGKKLSDTLLQSYQASAHACSMPSLTSQPSSGLQLLSVHCLSQPSATSTHGARLWMSSPLTIVSSSC